MCLLKKELKKYLFQRQKERISKKERKQKKERKKLTNNLRAELCVILLLI